jgi:hypothetical protein
MSNKIENLVCVLCGEPWIPGCKNRCQCGGFCSWGPHKGAEPSSWTRTKKGYIPNPVPPEVPKQTETDKRDPGQ